MKKRKTIKICDLIRFTNKWLDQSRLSSEDRETLSSFIEMLLHEHHIYGGFNYRYWVKTGYDKWVLDGKPEDNTPYLYGPRGKTDIIFYQ